MAKIKIGLKPAPRKVGKKIKIGLRETGLLKSVIKRQKEQQKILKQLEEYSK